MPSSFDRRSFLKTSSLLTLAATLGPSHSFGAQKEDKLNIALIGCGSIMTGHTNRLVRDKQNVHVSWLCDVDPAQMEEKAAILDGFQATPPQRTTRHEDVLHDKNVDAVIIATPHHWHCPMAVAAMEAGKDVYLEKPLSHVYNEGHLIKAAAKKYGRIVQQGSQMRNSPVTLEAEKLLKEGIIGEVKVARAWTAEQRRVLKPVPDSNPPAGVDYDRWLGPAPKRPFNEHRFHLKWRLFRDYGNGEIGDDGIHDLDMATWGLGIDTLPKQITARGSRMMLHGHVSEYPDNLNVTYEYPDGRLLVYENYPFTAYGMHGFDNGNVFYGTEGYMIFSRRGAFSVFLGQKEKKGPTESKAIRSQRGYSEHMTEFLSSVRTRQTPKANPEVGHRSCALVHLGEIAYRTEGRLAFDPETEQFLNNDEANAMLTKDYREPYTVPAV